MESHTLLGALLQVVACVTSACGLVLQRASASFGPSESDPDTALSDTPRRLLCVLGVVFCALSALPDMLSYLFAPQSLLALLCTFEPMLVTALGFWLLPEDTKSITKQEMLAAGVGMAGLVGCAAFAPSTSVLVKEPQFEEVMHFRLVGYACVALPAYGLLLWAEHVEKRRRVPARFQGIMLPALAAMSLALQRLSLAALGSALQLSEETGSLLWAVLGSPTAVVALLMMAACALSCLFHVWLGTQQQPPHVFMLAYCTISAAVQLVQSMLVLREFREEALGKVVGSMLLSGVSLTAVGWIHQVHVERLLQEDMEATIRCEMLVPLGGAISFVGMVRHLKGVLQPIAVPLEQQKAFQVM